MQVMFVEDNILSDYLSVGISLTDAGIVHGVRDCVSKEADYEAEFSLGFIRESSWDQHLWNGKKRKET